MRNKYYSVIYNLITDDLTTNVLFNKNDKEADGEKNLRSI